MIAAEVGGSEVSLAVLAATLVDVVDFFPVVFLYGVAKFLFSALALASVSPFLASFVVAMTVIPLFCSRFLKAVPHVPEHAKKDGEYDLEPTEASSRSWMDRFNARFNRMFNKLLDFYEVWVRRALQRPGLTVALLAGVFVVSLAIYPLLGLAFFPKTDAGQFTINIKVPTGTRIEMTDQYVSKVEDLIRKNVGKADLENESCRILALCRTSPPFIRRNSGPYTATVQVALNEPHSLSSFDYMDRVQKAMATQFPDIRTFFSSGSMVDAILNMGMPAPIDVQVSSPDLEQIYGIAQSLATRFREVHGSWPNLYPAGHGLSGATPRCGPRSRRRAGADPKRCGRQRNYSAEFRLHDCSELLGRPQEVATTTTLRCSTSSMARLPFITCRTWGRFH